MKKRLHEILNTQISRRETVTTAAKIGSAVALRKVRISGEILLG